MAMGIFLDIIFQALLIMFLIFLNTSFLFFQVKKIWIAYIVQRPVINAQKIFTIRLARSRILLTKDNDLKFSLPVRAVKCVWWYHKLEK